MKKRYTEEQITKAIKQLISPQLSLRDYNEQRGEALTGVKALNKVIRLVMPVRQTIS